MSLENFSFFYLKLIFDIFLILKITLTYYQEHIERWKNINNQANISEPAAFFYVTSSILCRKCAYARTHTHINTQTGCFFSTSLQVYYRESAHTNTHTHTSIILIQPKSSLLVRANFIGKVYNILIDIFSSILYEYTKGYVPWGLQGNLKGTTHFLF